MIYNLATPLDRQRLKARLKADLEKGSVVEYKNKAQRTRQQNRYLHLILGVVAMETGNTVAYTKERYFKALVNPALFSVDKEDKYLGEVTVLRSTRDLTKEEMATAIDRFKRWGAENGIFIPDAADEETLRQIEVEMGRLEQWL